MNVSAGIVNNFLIGPYLLVTRLNDVRYLIFLEQVLPELLQDVPIAIHNHILSRHDAAQAYLSADVRTYLHATFEIGHGGSVLWSPISGFLANRLLFMGSSE